MSYADIIRQQIALADRLTTDLQDTIQFYAWIGSDDFTNPRYADPIPMKALVEDKVMEKRLPDGREVVQHAMVTILRPVAANGAAERREPIDERDKIVLPNGYTGPILSVNGLIDPSTHAAYMFEVMLG